MEFLLNKRRLGAAVFRKGDNDEAGGAILLFDILNLFPDFLEFSFCAHNTLANVSIVCFRADRVKLPVNFLAQEVERSANRFVGIKILAKTIDVRGEPCCFLLNIRSISKEGDFF